MNKLKKIIIMLIVLLVIIASVIIFIIWNKNHEKNKEVMGSQKSYEEAFAEMLDSRF